MSTLPFLITGATAITAIAAAVVEHDLHRRSSEYLDTSVHRGPGDRNAIALTFDGGPGPQTLSLLAWLRAERVHATFFQCGLQVKQHPEITRAIHRAGYEIANHAYSHRQLSPRLLPRVQVPSSRVMYRELAQTQRLLTDICGEPPRFFRAPYGKSWIGLDAVRQRLGLVDVKWTVTGHNTKWTAHRIAEHVLSRAKPGAILRFTDSRDLEPVADLSEVLRALTIFVPALREKGYSFETLSDLMSPVPQFVPVTIS